MHMRREIDEIPDAVERLAASGAQTSFRNLAHRLRTLDPPAILTVARGSSDHAAAYLKYAAELTLGRPVASIGPSTVTVHNGLFRAEGLLTLAISQSGASRDLSAVAAALGEAGAHVVTLTNTPGSALADVASDVIDVAAGPERAVAATKSFVNSIVAGLWLIALWAEDQALISALGRLPEALAARRAVPEIDATFARLKLSQRAMVIGRGAGLGVAGEVALKLIETCGIHASAYSGAEVLHGPSAILSDGFPVIALTSGARKGLDQAVAQLTGQGADVASLPGVAITGHDLVDPLLDLPALYGALEALSRARGMSTDAPPFLRKETKTL